MKILCIGNSFSEDATRYLHQIARSVGEDIQVANLYIGGCPLEKHFRNMYSDERAYNLMYNGQTTYFMVSLREALLNRSWDVVTVQQASPSSPKPATYTPYGEELAEFVRELCPKAKIIVHQTWAYEDGSPKLLDLMGYPTHDAMFADIENAYNIFAENIDAYGLIPSGKLMQKMLKNGIEKIHRDTFHATKGLSRYAMGLLWYRMLTGKSVAEIPFNDFDEPVSAEEMALAKKLVDEFTPFQ
ncbi:MAG: DUF4886 domain-containing protein [Oscillospiraceae bacterium]|nr:DUF4886 domain-containing protein [Oscillospiraceae bacterium]